MTNKVIATMPSTNFCNTISPLRRTHTHTDTMRTERHETQTNVQESKSPISQVNHVEENLFHFSHFLLVELDIELETFTISHIRICLSFTHSLSFPHLCPLPTLVRRLFESAFNWLLFVRARLLMLFSLHYFLVTARPMTVQLNIVKHARPERQTFATSRIDPSGVNVTATRKNPSNVAAIKY